MAENTAQRAYDLFARAAALPTAQRAEFLRRECPHDAALRAEVESLLKFHNPDDRFLSGSALLDSGLHAEADECTLPPGTRLGRYTIAAPIGSGGMGVVYEAVQDSPRRRVALKVMRPGLMTAGLLRRFRHEAAALALLDHPGIAQIYEAGKEPPGPSGTPFLAMELVRGIPISTFVNARNLDTRHRLLLFLAVCEAVAHAHQRGVIHRDLKPANVLVDERGRPRVLDFGIARLTGATEGTTAVTIGHTLGGQLVGTLNSMSPEQAAGDPALVDVRADVYALGVLLYEMLTGRPPIDVSRCALPEAVLKITREAPARLSAHSRALKGDVETIAARALEKDKLRRYPSAAELAEDVRRHLAGEPIRAKQDSALYVLGKTVRRHRLAVSIALAVFAGLSTLTVYAVTQSRREAVARLRAEWNEREARAAREHADAVARRLDAELFRSNVENGRLLAESGNFLAAEEILWREHLRHPDSLVTHFALRDLYGRFPVLLAVGGGAAGEGRILDLHPSKRLVAASRGRREVCFIDLDSGESVSSAFIDESYPMGSAFTPDGATFVLLIHDGTLRGYSFLDAAIVAERWSVQAHERLGADAAISPDGSLLATVGVEPAVHLFDPRTGARIRSIPVADGEPERLRSVAFEKNGRRLAAAHSASIFLIDPDEPDDALAVRRIGRQPATITSLDFLPDGSGLVSGSTDANIRLWNFETGRVQTRIVTGNGTVRTIRVADDGNTVATSGWWRTEVWDLAARRRIFHDPRPVGGFGAVLLPGNRLAANGNDSRFRIWDLSPRPMTASVQAHTRWVGKLGVSADGEVLASVSSDGSAAAWRASDLSLIQRWSVPDIAWQVAVSRDGSTIAYAGQGGRIRVHRADAAEPFAEFDGIGNGSFDLSFSRGSSRLIYGAFRGKVQCWDIGTEQELWHFDHGGESLALAFDDEGRFTAMVLRGEPVILLDNDTGEEFARFASGIDPHAAAISPDASRLVLGGWHGSLELWSIPDGKRLYAIRAHGERIHHIRFSPDGRCFATLSDDGPVRLWETATGTMLTRLEGTAQTPGDPDRTIARLCFIPGGESLAVGWAGGRIELWSLDHADRCILGNLDSRRAHPKEPLEFDSALLDAWAQTLRR